MIEKEIIDGTEHISLRFGDGNLTVAASYPCEGGVGVMDRLLICENGTGVIGERNEALEEGTCSTELKNPVVLIFKNVESLDVVMKQLQDVRDSMASCDGAHRHVAQTTVVNEPVEGGSDDNSASD